MRRYLVLHRLHLYCHLLLSLTQKGRQLFPLPLATQMCAELHTDKQRYISTPWHPTVVQV